MMIAAMSFTCRAGQPPRAEGPPAPAWDGVDRFARIAVLAVARRTRRGAIRRLHDRDAGHIGIAAIKIAVSPWRLR